MNISIKDILITEVVNNVAEYLHYQFVKNSDEYKLKDIERYLSIKYAEDVIDFVYVKNFMLFQKRLTDKLNSLIYLNN